MNETARPRTREELLDRVQRAHQAIDRLAGGLLEEELSAPGPDGDWSIKDHLAHIVAWQQRLLAYVEGRPLREVVDLDSSALDELQAYVQSHDHEAMDRVNELIRRRYELFGGGEVLRDFRDTYANLFAAVERVSEEDLNRARFAANPSAEPLESPWSDPAIAGDSYEHDEEHLEYIQRLAPGS